MVGSRWSRTLAGLVAASVALPGAPALAGECRVVELGFQPADAIAGAMKPALQIVAWIESSAGVYQDTVFMTRQTATHGLGNRPGRYDFNSGPAWPYGRRVGVFPVWAHRYEAWRAATNAHPPWPQVVFRNGDENNLSHPFNESSRENHFCRPLIPTEDKWRQAADAGTCASTVYTDKGKAGGGTSLYPPRADIARTSSDDIAVEDYGPANPFDAISQATPVNGAPAQISWPIPPNFPAGDYVMWFEVSREFDHNEAYGPTRFPAPQGIPWADYGAPYRGQPSVLYRVPFTVGTVETSATTTAYVGYGDPNGADGVVRAPDTTITVDVPGSGAQRFALTGEGYRARVVARPEFDYAAPAAPGDAQVIEATSSRAAISFTAPGDDGLLGTIKGYDVRMRAGEPITDDNFADSVPLTAPAVSAPGTAVSVTADKLLFDTTYYIAVRAYDDCRNVGPLTVVEVRTAERATGEVDACFVATAAYGSLMANDVELLRRFRDVLLDETVLGELAVATYYTFGPAVAGVVGESDLLRHTARVVLDPLVALVKRFRF